MKKERRKAVSYTHLDVYKRQLIAIGVVAWLASRPTWSKFQVFDSVDDANTMTKALDDQSITWKASSDGKTI